MTYMLTFDVDDEIVDIFVRVGRPMHFRSFIQHYVLNNITLSSGPTVSFDTRYLLGACQLDRDYPWQYELSSDGILSANEET